MSTIELVDPELRDALALWPLQPLTADTLMQRRADSLKLIATVQTRDLPDIAADEIRVDSAFAAKPVRVLRYRPVKSDNPLPAIVHIHGGGFVAGVPEMKDVENRLLGLELKCAIYSVDYRLAPEAPHPAPLEDIYSMFAGLHGNAGQLGLDPARIGIKAFEPCGGAGRVPRIPGGVSRLLSGNECPRDETGRARQSRSAAALPARIGRDRGAEYFRSSCHDHLLADRENCRSPGQSRCPHR
jgi:hypothetical protein